MQSRPRANTITCTKSPTKLKDSFIEKDQNQCSFDSLLHSTICCNLNNSMVASKLSDRKKVKKTNEDLTTLKLKTSVLNQFNPNLTPEEMSSRKLNDIEKWLYNREALESEIKTTTTRPDSIENNLCNEDQKIFYKNYNSSKNSPLPHQLKQQKEDINNTKMRVAFEHLNIPISGNPSEFETLIENEEDLPETSSKCSSVRFVHIHHHFYHYDDGDHAT